MKKKELIEKIDKIKINYSEEYNCEYRFDERWFTFNELRSLISDEINGLED